MEGCEQSQMEINEGSIFPSFTEKVEQLKRLPGRVAQKQRQQKAHDLKKSIGID
jgi:hypothetical protein